MRTSCERRALASLASLRRAQGIAQLSQPLVRAPGRWGIHSRAMSSTSWGVTATAARLPDYAGTAPDPLRETAVPSVATCSRVFDV